MELVKREIIIGRGRNDFKIRVFSDVHEDSAGHDEALFNRALSIQQKDKHSYCIFIGDLIDSDRHSMRERKERDYAEYERKDAWAQQDRRDMAWLKSKVIPKYKRIADRCLGILDGDHFIRFSNGMTSGQFICKHTGIPYLGERMGFVVLNFTIIKNRAYRYIIMARHGRGSGVTSGGSVNAMERQNHGFVADLYLGGHNHREHIHPLKVCEVNRLSTGINQRVVWYVRGGSFLNGYPGKGKTTYAEREEYRPLCQGWCEVDLVVRRMRNPATLATNARQNRVVKIEATKAAMVAH